MSKKRKIIDACNDVDREFVMHDCISDHSKMVTENAILSILRHVPLQSKQMNGTIHDKILIPRGVFLHQLFAIVQNKTLVHAEVQQLKEDGIVKLLYCSNQDGPSNYFIMIMHDYFDSIQSMIDDLCLKSSGDDSNDTMALHKSRADSLEKFCTYAVSSKNISIFKEDIQKELSSDEISDVVKAGYLSYRRDSASTEDIYWYSHPSFGYLNEWIRLTREYVTNTIQRKKYKEISCKRQYIIFQHGLI